MVDGFAPLGLILSMFSSCRSCIWAGVTFLEPGAGVKAEAGAVAISTDVAI